MQKVDRPITEMPQIDGLRTFAVLAAIFSHYLPNTCTYFNYGHAGVQLFFTISGFLITGILLSCKSKIGNYDGNISFYLKQFYARRFLRIFPLYYCTLIVLIFWNKLGDTTFFHLTYTSNIAMTFKRQFIQAGHFWSLCVEEQFYIFWPFIIFYTPQRYIKKIILSLIPLAILFRIVCIANGYPEQTVYLLPANLDCLAIGSILAIAQTTATNINLTKTWSRLSLATGILGFCIVFSLSVLYPQSNGIGSTARFISQNTILVFISASLVWDASFGYQGIIGKLLNLSPLRYIGRISYGLYVLHPFVPMATQRFLKIQGHHLPLTISVPIDLSLTILLSAFSWHFFENPINKLKRFFPYTPVASTTSPEIHSNEISSNRVPLIGCEAETTGSE